MIKVAYNLVGETVLIRTYENDIVVDSSEIKFSELENEKVKEELVKSGYVLEEVENKNISAHWDEEQRDVIIDDDIKEENNEASIKQEELDKFETKLKETEEKMKKVEKKIEEVAEDMNDQLHPDRYGGDTVYECKKVAENWHTPEQYEGWLLITIERYLSRFGKKDNKLLEAKKIANYAQFLVEFEEKQSLKNN